MPAGFEYEGGTRSSLAASLFILFPLGLLKCRRSLYLTRGPSIPIASLRFLWLSRKLNVHLRRL